jgi:hypothetical protein
MISKASERLNGTPCRMACAVWGEEIPALAQHPGQGTIREYLPAILGQLRGIQSQKEPGIQSQIAASRARSLRVRAARRWHCESSERGAGEIHAVVGSAGGAVVSHEPRNCTSVCDPMMRGKAPDCIPLGQARKRASVCNHSPMMRRAAHDPAPRRRRGRASSIAARANAARLLAAYFLSNTFLVFGLTQCVRAQAVQVTGS